MNLKESEVEIILSHCDKLLKDEKLHTFAKALIKTIQTIVKGDEKEMKEEYFGFYTE